MPTAFGMIIAVFFFVMLVMLDTRIFIYNETATSTQLHCAAHRLHSLHPLAGSKWDIRGTAKGTPLYCDFISGLKVTRGHGIIINFSLSLSLSIFRVDLG